MNGTVLRHSQSKMALLLGLVCSLVACSPDKNATPPETSDASESRGGDEAAVAVSEVHQWNVDESGYAIHGYDPVSYVEDAKPTLGNEAFETTWEGVRWRFANEENKAAFEASPEKYAPANGGFCTFGVVLSKKFDGDPQVWSERDGAVYLFLNEDVKEKFFQDSEGNLSRVKENWPVIKGSAPEELE